MEPPDGPEGAPRGAAEAAELLARIPGQRMRPWLVLQLGVGLVATAAAALVLFAVFLAGSYDTCATPLHINNTKLGSLASAKLAVWPLLRAVEPATGADHWIPYWLSSLGMLCHQKVCISEHRAKAVHKTGYQMTHRRYVLESEARATADYYVLSSSRRVKGARHATNLVVMVPNQWRRGVSNSKGEFKLCGVLSAGTPDFARTDTSFMQQYPGGTLRPMVLNVEGRTHKDFAFQKITGADYILVLLFPLFRILCVSLPAGARLARVGGVIWGPGTCASSARSWALHGEREGWFRSFPLPVGLGGPLRFAAQSLQMPHWFALAFGPVLRCADCTLAPASTCQVPGHLLPHGRKCFTTRRRHPRVALATFAPLGCLCFAALALRIAMHCPWSHERV